MPNKECTAEIQKIRVAPRFIVDYWCRRGWNYRLVEEKFPGKFRIEYYRVNIINFCWCSVFALILVEYKWIGAYNVSALYFRASFSRARVSRYT